MRMRLGMVALAIGLLAPACGRGDPLPAFCDRYDGLAQAMDDVAAGLRELEQQAASGETDTGRAWRARRDFSAAVTRQMHAADEARVAAPDDVRPELNRLWELSRGFVRLQQSGARPQSRGAERPVIDQRDRADAVVAEGELRLRLRRELQEMREVQFQVDDYALSRCRAV